MKKNLLTLFPINAFSKSFSWRLSEIFNKRHPTTKGHNDLSVQMELNRNGNGGIFPRFFSKTELINKGDKDLTLKITKGGWIFENEIVFNGTYKCTKE